MNNIMPDQVVDLIEAHYPDHIKAAATAMRQVRSRWLLCKTPYTAEAREYAISGMHAAAKVLATYPQPTEVVR